MDEEKTEETPLEEVVETPPEEVPEEIIKPEEEPSKEYTKERFDGLMSAWQKDRQDMLDLKKEVEGIKTAQTPKNQEDIWVDYLFDKIKNKEKANEEAEDKAAQQELAEVSASNPDLKKDSILETALKHKVNLSTAAGILREIQTGTAANSNLTAAELARKKSAGKIGGKPGGTTIAGIKPWDAEKDKGKRPEELMEEGLKELGIK